MTYCIKSLKTNRCVKSKYQDNTSIECNHNYSTNRCNLTRKKTNYSSKNKKKNRPKSISMPKSLKNKKEKIKKMDEPTNTIVDYHGYLVEIDVKSYLEKLIMKKSGKKIREMNEKYELYMPVDEYPNDNDLKEYLIKDILFLSSNDVRDRTKTNAITLNNVHYVIVNDPSILPLFGNKYKGLFKLKKNDIEFDYDKIRKYKIELIKPYYRYEYINTS